MKYYALIKHNTEEGKTNIVSVSLDQKELIKELKGTAKKRLQELYPERSVEELEKEWTLSERDPLYWNIVSIHKEGTSATIFLNYDNDYERYDVTEFEI